MKIPESFVLNKFYSYSYEPVFRKHDGTYNAGCPVCKEGKSLGKKKRLFFYPESNTFHCFNCSKTWSAYNWISKVCNLSKDELDYEIINNTNVIDLDKKNISDLFIKKKELPDLPYDSINIYDCLQQEYYSENLKFKECLSYIKSRRLDTAINKSVSLFISLTDIVHKNRICLPFYDRTNKIVFYQTRCIDNTNPKYMGKVGYDKTLFGIEKIDINIPYIFIFEGPIDSMFVKNGISAAGITLTKVQKNQLSEFPFHKKIWVLDNPRFDETASEKIKELVSDGEFVFMWKDNMPYKDFNEMCMFEELDEINYNDIINTMY